MVTRSVKILEVVGEYASKVPASVVSEFASASATGLDSPKIELNRMLYGFSPYNGNANVSALTKSDMIRALKGGFPDVIRNYFGWNWSINVQGSEAGWVDHLRKVWLALALANNKGADVDSSVVPCINRDNARNGFVNSLAGNDWRIWCGQLYQNSFYSTVVSILQEDAGKNIKFGTWITQSPNAKKELLSSTLKNGDFINSVKVKKDGTTKPWSNWQQDVAIWFWILNQLGASESEVDAIVTQWVNTPGLGYAPTSNPVYDYKRMYILQDTQNNYFFDGDMINKITGGTWGPVKTHTDTFIPHFMGPNSVSFPICTDYYEDSGASAWLVDNLPNDVMNSRPRKSYSNTYTPPFTGGGGCFSELCYVNVQQGSTIVKKLIKEIQHGDQVESIDPETQERFFSTVVTIVHDDEDLKLPLVQLSLGGSAKPLELTGTHLLFVSESGNFHPQLKESREVKVGDWLWNSEFKPQQVEKVGVNFGRVLSPQTVSGYIVVNGLACSVYDESHMLKRLATLPLRAVYPYSPSAVNSVTTKFLIRFLDNYVFSPLSGLGF